MQYESSAWNFKTTQQSSTNDSGGQIVSWEEKRKEPDVESEANAEENINFPGKRSY